MKKGIVISLAILAILGIAGVAFFFVSQKSEEERRVAEINGIAQGAGDIVEDVQSTVSTKAPVIWVYDRDKNFIMTLKASNVNGSIESAPEELMSAVKTNKGDLFVAVVDYFLQSNGTSTDLRVAGYLQRVRQEFDEQTLVRYLATKGTYSNGPSQQYTGILDASIGIFGVEPSQLNATQLSYLGYALDNSEATVADFCKLKGLNMDALGISTIEILRPLRQIVSDGLKNILGDQLTENNFSVMLSYSLSQSMAVQNIVDRECRSLTQLATDGSYAINCSVLAVDKNSGYIRVMVPGRSGNGMTNDLFRMNLANVLEGLTELQKQVNAGLLVNSLMEIKKPNGDVELQSLGNLFESRTLAGSNTDTTPGSTLDLTSTLFNLGEVQGKTGMSVIYQVIADGKTVYQAPDNIKLEFKSDGMFEFFKADVDKPILCQYDVQLDSGIVYVYFTADYVLVVLVGSGAAGLELPAMQYPLFNSVVQNVKGVVASFYPTPKNTLWNPDALEGPRAQVYAHNQQFVLKIFDESFGELSDIEIDSSTRRLEFEDAYTKLGKFVSDYTSYIGLSCSEGLRARMTALRTERSELLIKYSV